MHRHVSKTLLSKFVTAPCWGRPDFLLDTGPESCYTRKPMSVRIDVPGGPDEERHRFQRQQIHWTHD